MIQSDGECRIFAEGFRAALLRGSSSAWMCAAVSAPLCAALEILGVKAQLVETDLGECNHVFLQLASGLYLDPTADQFNWCSRDQLPPVYLGSGAAIHEKAVPWPGGAEWRPLLAEFLRLCPEFEAGQVGRMVGSALRTLPAGFCEFRKIGESTRPGLNLK